MNRTIAFLASVLVALGLSAAAQQQPQDQTGRMMGPGMVHGPGMGQGWMMGPSMMYGPGMMQGSGVLGPMMSGPRQHIEGRLAFLKTELKITPQRGLVCLR